MMGTGVCHQAMQKLEYTLKRILRVISVDGCAF